MKHLIIILITFVSFSCGSTIEENAEPGIEQENFDGFFFNFMSDPDFQLSRVKFPLESSYMNGEDLETTHIEKVDWRHNSFYMEESAIPIIYNNYQMELQDTDERLFLWQGGVVLM